jgi:hypothetical protein
MQPGQGAADIDEAALQRGNELGSGGEGWVYRVHGQPEPTAFKKYKDPRRVDPSALKTLADLPGQLQPSERDRLHQQTAWPRARVYDKGKLSGFLMREIPGRFMAPNSAGAVKNRALQYLLYPRMPLWGDIVPAGGVSTQTRIDVAREFTGLVTLLHSRTLVIGDVSSLNLLWTGTDGQPVTIFLIDCDGIRSLGQAPVSRQLDTPGWGDDQQPPTGPDLDTDRYKLALVVGRTLSCQAELYPGKHPLALPPDVPDRMADRIQTLWKQAAGPYGQRPDAKQWLNAFANRDEIVLAPLGPARKRYPTSVGMADPDPPANTPRQGIPVTPPTQRPRPQAAPPPPRPFIPLRPPAPPPKP